MGESVYCLNFAPASHPEGTFVKIRIINKSLNHQRWSSPDSLHTGTDTWHIGLGLLHSATLPPSVLHPLSEASPDKSSVSASFGPVAARAATQSCSLQSKTSDPTAAAAAAAAAALQPKQAAHASEQPASWSLTWGGNRGGRKQRREETEEGGNRGGRLRITGQNKRITDVYGSVVLKVWGIKAERLNDDFCPLQEVHLL